MFNEKILKEINHKFWKKDTKILNYNEFNVFNVELYKEKMPFIFDDILKVKNCSPNDIAELETKLKELFEELSRIMKIDIEKFKIFNSKPIDPINPELFFANCYFTPARVERVFVNGMTKDSYYEYRTQMSEEEFLNKYSTLKRMTNPVIRNEEQANEYILNSKLYYDYRESILSDKDEIRIDKLEKFKLIMKDTAQKDLETIDIDDKFIEGYSFKYCNGLYVTCFIAEE